MKVIFTAKKYLDRQKGVYFESSMRTDQVFAILVKIMTWWLNKNEDEDEDEDEIDEDVCDESYPFVKVILWYFFL